MAKKTEKKSLEQDTPSKKLEIEQKDALIPQTKKNIYDTIELGSSFSLFESKYFVGSLNFHAGYYFYRWTYPFYFGADMDFGVAFPKKDFPHKYSVLMKNTKVVSMHSPYLMHFAFYVPIGFVFEPFSNDVKFLTELYSGIEFNKLWNGSSKNSIVSKIFVSPTASLFTGVGYKFFMFKMGIGYNKISKFSFTVKVDFNIKMKYSEWFKKKKIEGENEDA